MLRDLIASLENKFRLTNKDNSEKFLNNHFAQKSKNVLEFNLYHLIQYILKASNLNNDSKMHNTPVNHIFYKDVTGRKRI